MRIPLLLLFGGSVFGLQTPLPQARQTRLSLTWSSTFTQESESNLLSFENMKHPSLELKELFGEALGTFSIVGLGSAASMGAAFLDPMPLAQIALVWSSAVVFAIAITNELSGAHLNPAMTLAFALFRNFEWEKVMPYSFAQVLGAAGGSAASYSLYANAISDFEAAQGLERARSISSACVFGEYFDSSLTALQAFGVEALGTAVLASVAFFITHPRTSTNAPASLFMGATVYLLSCLLAPLTQAGLNPARDFGPRIVAYVNGWTDVAFNDFGVYLVAPMLGATLGAAFIERVVYGDERNDINTQAGSKVLR